MSNNYEGKRVAQNYKPRKKKPLTKWQKFVRFIHKDKRGQACAVLALCLLVSGASRLYQYNVDKDKYEALMEKQKDTIIADYEGRISELNLAHQGEITDVRSEYENLTPEEQKKQEAEYIAKVLYGTARNHDERDQRTLVWCILNRVDSPGYPNSVQSVCQQASQWIGYDDDNPIIQELFDLAMKELETWHNNYRPVNKEYLYMSWSGSEIKLRDTYTADKNTNYWQAG